MTASQSLDILNYCLIGFNLVIAFLILNWTLCFSILSRSQCLKPRLPIISILIGSFNAIFCGVDRNQILLHSNLSNPLEYPGWILVNALCVQLWVLTLFFIAYRGWIIYYTIKFNKALQDKQWRLYINPAENDWFLKHRKSYGSAKKMIVPFLVGWFITAAVYWSFIIHHRQFTQSSRAVIIIQTAMVMLFLIYLWYKIPKFDDIWRIRNELIITIRLLLVGITVFFVLAIVLNWQPGSWRYGVLSTVGTLSALAICYSVLYYPLNRFGLPTFISGALYVDRYLGKDTKVISTKSHKKKQQLHIEYRGNQEQNKGNLSSKQWGTQFYKLKAILADKDGFRLFAAHLMKEYAIEHLLFFVETSQWMDYVNDQCLQDNIALSVNERAAQVDVNLHKNAPKSRIVSWNRDDDRQVRSFQSHEIDSTASGLSAPSARRSQTLSALTMSSGGKPSAHAQQLTIDLNLAEFELPNAINDPWFQCVKLFQKYVANGSYFCINISGEDRIKLYELLGYDNNSTKCEEELVEILRDKCENNMDKLYHIFDTARYAVFRLMLWSVSRFETSDLYLEHFIPCEHDQ
eukprot:41492_1